MSLTLGEKLRQAREERGISISEVAEQTRISSLYLEAIENNDYKPLPGGIFNKGFVKSYAKFIGVDEQEALQDYSKIVAQTSGVPDDEPKKYRPEVLTDDNAAPSMIPTIIFAGIILALMTGGVLFVVNYLQNQPPPPAANNNTANVNSAANTEEAEIPRPMPEFNELRVEFAALNEPIALTSTVDGRMASDTVQPGTPKVLTGSDSVKLSYYKGFAESVEISLNGRKLMPPVAPDRGNSVTVEITKTTAPIIWQRGSLNLTEEELNAATPDPAAAATPAATPASGPAQPVSTPASVQSTPTPAATEVPATTPARTPTPARALTPANRPAANRAATPAPSPRETPER